MTQAATGTGKTGGGKPRIKVLCKACGGKFAVGLEKAGKKGPCPKCGQPIVVPKVKAKAKPAATAPAADAGGIDWGALADAEANAAPVDNQPMAAAVGDDEYGLAEDDALPKNRPLSKKRVAPKVEAAAAAAGGSGLGRLTPAQRAAIAKRAEAKASGKMTGYSKGDDPAFGYPSAFAGIAFCLIGAALGGAIWFGLLMATGKELRFLAWVVGALAGTGMWLGRGGPTPDALRRDGGMALLAGLLAVGGIVGAKALMYNFGQAHFAVNEIETEAMENMQEARLEIEEEYSRPEPLEWVEPFALDWMIQDSLREQGITQDRYDAASELFQGRWAQDARREFHQLDEDEVRDLYARSLLASLDEQPDTSEARAAYDAARAKFIEDNDLKDPYAYDESEDEEDEEGEEGEEDVEDEPEEEMSDAELERKWRREMAKAKFDGIAFRKAMKPFEEEHGPILQKALGEAAKAHYDKWMAKSEDEIAELYAAHREAEKQDALARIDESKDDFYASERALTAHVYSDEFVENREAYRPVGISDVFFGIVAFATAIGIALGGGGED